MILNGSRPLRLRIQRSHWLGHVLGLPNPNVPNPLKDNLEFRRHPGNMIGSRTSRNPFTAPGISSIVFSEGAHHVHLVHSLAIYIYYV